MSQSLTLLEKIKALQSSLRETPVVQLDHEGVFLHAKLEYHNPFGSVKDRPAFWILKSNIESFVLGSESIVVESSSGNFATALACYCRLLGIQFIPVIDPNINANVEFFLRGMCSRVEKVDVRDDTGGFLKTRLQRVESLLEQLPGAYWTNQYASPLAFEAHYRLTAEEICQTFTQLDYVFVGVSTAGTIAGLSCRLKERFPSIRVIAVDTEGSVIFGGQPKRRYIPGIGASITPELLQMAKIDDVVKVPEIEAVQACNELLYRHGLFVGGSSGSAYAAVKRYLPTMRSLTPPRVLFLCADRGSAYLNTVFNPAWAHQLQTER